LYKKRKKEGSKASDGESLAFERKRVGNNIHTEKVYKKKRKGNDN